MGIKELTAKEYNKYKDNDDFLHNVAFAHGCLNEDMEFLHNKALCSYTVAKSDFKVPSKIQEIAKREYQKRKMNIVKGIKVNELVFVGMGMDFNPLNNEHIGNHRIRTYFKDNNKCLCFVEFGSSVNKNFLRCGHAIKDTKRNCSDWDNLKQREDTEKRIYKLEGLRSGSKAYTKKNILKLVNDNFDTNFKNVKIFSYFLSPDDYTSISHKRN